MSEKDRVILHCDLNSFYASVECLYHPEVKGKPVAVGGEKEKRHGIILTKNPEAKKYGVKTGEPLWQAYQKCPDLIVFPPRFELYLRYSELVRQIFYDYTDKIEPFGIDEAWLDVTDSIKLFGDGKTIADTIRKRIYNELGITASVGVSYNKIFAKLGSDYKKPDATTVINKEDLEKIVFPLPVSDLLYVGQSSTNVLNNLKIKTIGDLAKTNPNFLKEKLGKNGLMLWRFANGYENDPVKVFQETNPIKSVGNSVTSARDIYNFDDLKMVCYILAESVASRLKDQKKIGNIIKIYIRDSKLNSFVRQKKIHYFTNTSDEIAREALTLFSNNTQNLYPLRSIGICITNLKEDNGIYQITLFDNQKQREKEKKLDNIIDSIRAKYGYKAIGRSVMLSDSKLTGFNPKEEHTIHPQNYLK